MENRSLGTIMNVTLGFDVYGALVDPTAMAEHVAREVGPKAAGRN